MFCRVWTGGGLRVQLSFVCHHPSTGETGNKLAGAAAELVRNCEQFAQIKGGSANIYILKNGRRTLCHIWRNSWFLLQWSPPPPFFCAFCCGHSGLWTLMGFKPCGLQWVSVASHNQWVQGVISPLEATPQRYWGGGQGPGRGAQATRNGSIYSTLNPGSMHSMCVCACECVCVRVCVLWSQLLKLSVQRCVCFICRLFTHLVC